MFTNENKHGQENLSSSGQTDCLKDVRADRNLYKYEKHRLETFHSWPRNSPVSKEDLASNGFYYLHTSDVVRCYFCGLTLKEWTDNDNVEEEHRRYRPLCPLLLGIPVGNISIDEGSVSKIRLDLLMYPAFDTYEKRLESFEDWPTSLHQQPHELSMAGFFYKGRGDIVQCFCCGGILKRWEPQDVPSKEHQRCFPACLFIQQFFQHQKEFDSAMHRKNILHHAKMMGYEELVKQYCRKVPPYDLSNIRDINHLIDVLENFRTKPEYQSLDEVDGQKSQCNHCNREDTTCIYECSHPVCEDCAFHVQKLACSTCKQNVRGIYSVKRSPPTTDL